MAEPNGTGRPPVNWRQMIPLGLAVGVGPAIGREVGAALRESWGYWPATLVGIATAGIAAVLVLAVARLVSRPRGDG